MSIRSTGGIVHVEADTHRLETKKRETREANVEADTHRLETMSAQNVKQIVETCTRKSQMRDKGMPRSETSLTIGQE